MSINFIEEPQIYKIYINEVEVLLRASKDVKFDEVMGPNTLVAAYDGVKAHILQYIQFIEKAVSIKHFILHYTDFDKLKADFKSYFKEVKAAGGLVKNEKEQYLFIHRRGSWDLPKGKIEKGESKRTAAIREVEEETGLKKMVIISRIGVTRHTYRSNVGRRLIKKSYWYLIEAPRQPLTPQLAEDIIEAKWLSLKTFFNVKRRVYPNILDIVHTQDTVGIVSKVEVKVL
jgi:8-oxo-dGTP pyrophosphatase MutT (NUDIX family)